MATNKFALLRYRVIDRCLQNRYRKWTLEDLRQQVSEAIYEYEGIDTGVSTRTLQHDLQMMRSDKLGYNAPIIVQQRKYYTYADPQYSILKGPIQRKELLKIKAVVKLLKQFSGFTHFGEINEVITTLQDKVDGALHGQPSYVQVEHNAQLKGLDLLPKLYHAIAEQQALRICYQSFRAKQPQTKTYAPYLLKEYRNRWFLIAQEGAAPHRVILAVDRIQSIKLDDTAPYFPYTGTDFKTYYADVIGVSKTAQQQPERVHLRFNAETAPYIETKPIHESQTVLTRNAESLEVTLKVILNLELERVILGFGAHVEVLAPAHLRRRIARTHQKAAAYYQELL